MRNASRVARLALFSIFASLIVTAQLTVPVVASGAPLGSAVFRGDAMLIGSNMPAPGLNDFTYEFYFKMNSLPSLAGVNTVGGGIWLFTTRPNRWNPGGITVYVNTNGSLILDANDSAAKSITSITSPSGTVAINNWYHLAVTRSGDIFKVWINGSQVSTGSALSTATGKTGNYNSTLLGLGEYLPGNITNFRFTSAEALYTSTFTPSSNQLTANGTSQVLIPLESDYITVSSYSTVPTLAQPTGAASGNAYFGGPGFQDATGNLNAGSYLTNNGITYSALNPFAKVTPTFTWSNVAKNSGDASFTLTAPTPSTPGTFTYTSGTTSVISLSDTTATVVAPGTSLITADFTPTDSSNYNSASTTMTITVSGANQAALTVNAASGTFGSTTTLGTTGGSGTGAVTYTVVSGNCSVSGDVLSSTSAGNCVLTATKAADATYNAITSAQVTVAIAKKTQVFSYSISSSTGSFTYGATYTVSMTFPADAVAGIGTWNVLKASTAYGVNAPGDEVCTGAAVTAAGTYTCSFNSANMYPTAQAVAISGFHVRFTGSSNYNAFSHTTDGTKITITGCDYVFCANPSPVTVTATNKTIKFGESIGSLNHTISNGANGATTAWGVGCTSTYTTGAAVGTYPIICTSTTRPTGAPTPITDDWVAQNTNFPNLYNANVDNPLYTLKNPANSMGICSSAAQWWVKCSFYTSDTYSNLSFVSGVLTVQKLNLSTPSTPSAAAVAGSPSTATVTYTQVANAASHTAKVYATNGTSLLQTILNYTSGATISGLSATTNYKISIIAVGDGTNTGTSNESTKVSITTNAKSTSRTIAFPTTSYSLNYGATQAVSAVVSARANIPTITFNGNNFTNTNPRLTTGINGNQGVNGNFFGYALEQGSFTEGQIVTMSDLSAGSTVTYSGKLHFLYAGGFGWAFFITDILSVTGSSANATSSHWLLTGEGAITYSAGASTACSVDRWTGIVTITSGTGTCEISSTVVEDSEYQALSTTVPVSISVSKLAQSTVTLSLSASSKSAPYSQAQTFTFGGGTGSGAITYAILAGGTAADCALANSSASNTITATSAGTCLVQATKAADSNYSAATSVAQTFTFNTSDQADALTVTSISGTYGDDLTLSSTGGSGSGAISFSTSTPGCSLPTTTTLRATGAITCQVTVSKAADANYNSSTSSLTNIVFAPKTLTITGLSGVNREFDGGVVSAATGTATLSGIINSDVVTLLGTPSYTFATAAAANGKTVTASGFSLTGDDSAKYVLTQPTVTASITKKNVTVTAASTTIAVGSSYTPAFVSSGLVGLDLINAVTYSFSSTGTGTPPTTAGTSTITPSAAIFGVVGAGDNYTISYLTGTLNIVSSYQISFKSNFTSSDNTSAIVNFTIGDNPISPVTPTRNNFTFLGWYTSAIGGTKVTGGITPTSDVVYWAHWIQNSLNGMGSANKIGTFTTDIQYLDTFTRSGNYGTVTVSIPAGALPHQTSVDIYQVTDPTRANTLLVGSNYVLSLVVAWLAPDATVPTTQAGKPVTMTISNATIKKGAKIYAIVNDVVTLLGTATQDGSAVVLITDDPEVVIVTTKPDAPIGVSATTGGKASTTVSWTAPSDGGSDIIKYIATDGSGKSCETVNTSCSITGLSEATSYVFTVIAVNAIGNSPASAPSASILTENTTALALAAQQAADALAAQQAADALAAQQAADALTAAAARAVAEKAAADAKAAAELKATQDRAAAEVAAAAALKATQDLADAQAKAAAELKAAQVKAAEEARIAAELKAAQEKADAELKAAAEAKAIQDAADAAALAAAELKAAQVKAAEEARIAAELKAAQEKADAELKAAAEKKALDDAKAAAVLAAKKIVPKVTLYSISSKLTLSTYDNSYLKKYVSTLKPKAKVTCVGYIYTKNSTYAKAKALASKQALAVCSLIKAQKKTILTSVVLYPASKAPKAAVGAKWVAVSYRVDGYKS